MIWVLITVFCPVWLPITSRARTSENEKDLTFVKVLARVMGKKLDQQGLENPALPTSPSSKQLEKETLQALYPADRSFTCLPLV